MTLVKIHAGNVACVGSTEIDGGISRAGNFIIPDAADDVSIVVAVRKWRRCARITVTVLAGV